MSLSSGSANAQKKMPTSRDLELDVIVNGYEIGLIGEFHERHGELYATRHELDSLGFKVAPAASPASAAAELPLAKLPGISYRLEENTQTLRVTAPDSALKPRIIEAEQDLESRGGKVESGLGAVLNYDVIATAVKGLAVTEGQFTGRVFTPWGLFSASGTAAPDTQSNLPPLLRLDTSYDYSDVDTMRQYVVGDFIGGGLSWSRPLRMGGVQISTDFGVRPDLVTFPVPSIAGQVAVPSSVDVLVNGVRLLSEDVPAGPFEIRQLPMVSGTGNISVVTRNAAGQQTTETLPFYSSTRLLTPGLSAYSAELGAVRLQYGSLSDDYQAPAGAGTYRYGVSDWLTLEGHMEATLGNNAYDGENSGSGVMGGGGAALTIGHLGVVSLDLASSRFGGRSGGLVSATAERNGRVLSLSGSIQLAQPDFTDLAAAYGQPVPSLQAHASIGLSLLPIGSFGLAFVETRQPGNLATRTTPISKIQTAESIFSLGLPPLVPASRTALLSASYSRSIFDGHAYAYVTAFNDFATAASAGVMFGLTVPFGDRGSAETSAGSGGNGPSESLQVTESAPNVGDLGWRLLEGTGAQPQQQATGTYKSPWGLVDAGIDRVNGQTAYQGEVQGALAFADGGLFAANSIDDSFAVVDTDHTKGIEVLQENRPIGRTGPSGLMLVPGLQSFESNRLAIDPTDVPADAEIGQTEQTVRPQDHSGVVVRFPIHFSHGALLRLVDSHKNILPVGSTARLVKPAGGAEVSIGYDGEAFVTGLEPRDILLVTLPDGKHCTAEFRYKRVAGILPEIGPILCMESLS
jgi:outer membrane usher protein